MRYLINFCTGCLKETGGVVVVVDESNFEDVKRALKLNPLVTFNEEAFVSSTILTIEDKEGGAK